MSNSGNTKAKIWAGVIAGIMCVALTTWVVVLLYMFDKQAVDRRIGE